MIRWLILAIGLASGLSAALVFGVSVSGRAQDGAEADVDMAQVVIAKVDLAAGSKIRAEDLAWVDWPEETLHPEFYDNKEDAKAVETLTGSVLRTNVSAGVPLMASLVSTGSTSYLANILTPGMRAVALPISAAQTAGGFILPEDRVDILLTPDCRDGAACVGGGKVEVILQDVRVLAIDQAGEVGADGTAIVGETATLELWPEDAKVLISALSRGTPTLVLRAVGDNARTAAPVEPDDASDDVPETQAAEAAPAPVMAAPVALSSTVRVIRNGEARSYEVNAGN